MLDQSPAFPVIVPGGGSQHSGLSQVDYVAVAAMQAILTRDASKDWGSIADEAYAMAQAMYRRSASATV